MIDFSDVKTILALIIGFTVLCLIFTSGKKSGIKNNNVGGIKTTSVTTTETRTIPNHVVDKLKDLLQNSKKEEAVKLYSQEMHEDLEDAKKQIDMLEELFVKLEKGKS